MSQEQAFAAWEDLRRRVEALEARLDAHVDTCQGCATSVPGESDA